jgi:hypothetical protein
MNVVDQSTLTIDVWAINIVVNVSSGVITRQIVPINRAMSIADYVI